MDFRETRKWIRLHWLPVFSILIALPLFYIVHVAPQHERVKEGLDYLSYLFPVYAALVGGRAVLETIERGKIEQHAKRCFIESIVFLSLGILCQVAKQLSASSNAVFGVISFLLFIDVLVFLWELSSESYVNFKRSNVEIFLISLMLPTSVFLVIMLVIVFVVAGNHS